MQETIDAREYLRQMQSLGQDIGHLGRRRNLDQPHLTILNDFVGEVLPDVDVLGTFPSSNDVVTPFDARGVVLVYWSRSPLRESKTVQKISEIQDLAASH